MTLTQVIPHYGNIWFYGNPMRRDLSETWDIRMMERDLRLSGHTSKVLITKGLESIPDKENP